MPNTKRGRSADRTPADNGGTTPPDGLTPDARPDHVRIAALGGTGYLRPDDIPPMNATERALFDLLRDGQPHTAAEIADAAGGWDPMRRARALRGRRAHIDGRTVLLSLICRRGPHTAGIYTLTMRDIYGTIDGTNDAKTK